MSDLLDLSADLAEIAGLAGDPDALESVLRRALDSLSAVIPYELAAVLELHDGRLEVRAARGPLASAAVRAHSVSLGAFPTIARALETRRPVALEAHHHASDEGDPYDGVLDLQDGHACMVVPLYAGDRTLGVMTFDQQQCHVYAPEVVAVAGVYGQVIALAMQLARQAALLHRQRQQLQEENRLLRTGLRGDLSPGELLARSLAPSMQALVRTARQVALADVPVLVLGETGTGKELLSEALHAWSGRASGPFVAVNCAALPENLVESELFGHIKGAFSGASAERRGRFATANGGTLLLDEIGELPLALQAKLLRVLQQGTFEPVGSDRTVKVDVRVIAATHVDLRAAVAAGRFREDLYYRLSVFPLTIPPLRERVDDVVPLVESTLTELGLRMGRGPWRVSVGARAALRAHAWPGNVRELRNAVERAVIVRPSGVLSAADLVGMSVPKAAASPLMEPSPKLSSLSVVERDHILRVLRHTGARLAGPSGAAQILGLKVTTLQSRMKRLGISREDALNRADV